MDLGGGGSFGGQPRGGVVFMNTRGFRLYEKPGFRNLRLKKDPELSGAICFTTLVLLSNALDMFRRFFDTVRAVFCFLSHFWPLTEGLAANFLLICGFLGGGRGEMEQADRNQQNPLSRLHVVQRNVLKSKRVRRLSALTCDVAGTQISRGLHSFDLSASRVLHENDRQHATCACIGTDRANSQSMHTTHMSGTAKATQRYFVTKILPNFRVNFLVQFASKP